MQITLMQVFNVAITKVIVTICQVLFMYYTVYIQIFEGHNFCGWSFARSFVATLNRTLTMKEQNLRMDSSHHKIYRIYVLCKNLNTTHACTHVYMYTYIILFQGYLGSHTYIAAQGMLLIKLVQYALLQCDFCRTITEYTV